MITLTGHRAPISHCQLSLDGSTGVSFAEDHRLIVWDVSECASTRALLSMDVHCGLQQMLISPNLNHVIGQPNNCTGFALFRFLRNPAGQKSIDELSRLRDQRNDLQRFHRQLSTLAQLGAARPMDLRRSIKREQSFDSLYWDRQLQRGMSVDDFTRLTGSGTNNLGPLSPAGSRDNLFFAGSTIATNAGSGMSGHGYQGTLEKIGQSMVSRPSRLVSKLIGGKQRTLKKQQSMFACFPEHSSSSGVLNTVGRVASPLASPAVLMQKSSVNPMMQSSNRKLISTSIAPKIAEINSPPSTTTSPLSNISSLATNQTSAINQPCGSVTSPLAAIKSSSPEFGSSRTISRIKGEEKTLDTLMRSHSLEEQGSGMCPNSDLNSDNRSPMQQLPVVDSSVCNIS